MNVSDQDILKHQAWMTRQLNGDRLGEKVTCDLILKSEGKSFFVHKCIMMISSQFFRNMFTVEMRERYADGIEMQHIPCDRLENLITFIYTGKIVITEDSVMDVLDDAEYTQVEALKAQCSHFLLKAVSPNNCIRLRAYAKRYNLQRVLTEVDKMLVEQFARVVEHKDFLTLEAEDVKAFVELRKKSCEAAAFDGIMRWIKHNPSQREEHFVDLFSKLDLCLMPSDFRRKVFSEELVKKNLSCANVAEYLLKLSTIPEKPVSDQFLLIGGCDSNHSPVRSCVLYDVITRQSKNLPNLDTDRCALAALKVGDSIYVLGGARDLYGNYTKRSGLVLDWTEKNRWSKIPEMLEARSFFSSVYLKGHIYAIGGSTVESHLACSEMLDVGTGRWTKIADLSCDKDEHGTVVCNDLLYCIGGQNGRHRALSVCEFYDPRCENWNKIAPLTQARYGFGCVEMNGMIYAIGGSNGQALAKVERYIPEADKWENVARLRTARERTSACVVGNKIFVVGGMNSSVLKSVECYDPKVDAWTTCFDLDKPVFTAAVVAV